VLRLPLLLPQPCFAQGLTSTAKAAGSTTTPTYDSQQHLPVQFITPGVLLLLLLLLLLPCLQDFYSKECWAHHPKPYADFMAFKQKERAELEAERKKAVRV
jgi:hypothetical protein